MHARARGSAARVVACRRSRAVDATRARASLAAAVRRGRWARQGATSARQGRPDGRARQGQRRTAKGSIAHARGGGYDVGVMGRR
eukprot:456999-Prymnesium_polylepis.1